MDKLTRERRERFFELVWEYFAHAGLADDRGSAEYRRALADYHRDGRPARPARWLRLWLTADDRAPAG
jgi:predicted RNA polymerase sigma factor